LRINLRTIKIVTLSSVFCVYHFSCNCASSLPSPESLPLIVCVKWIVSFLWLLLLSQIFPLDISLVKPFHWKVVTYSVVSSWLSRKETGSVCSILKLSLYSLAFKSCSEGEETSPLYLKLLTNFQPFSNIYHICWPCIVFIIHSIAVRFSLEPVLWLIFTAF